jgi:hypothetical protein
MLWSKQTEKVQPIVLWLRAGGCLVKKGKKKKSICYASCFEDDHDDHVMIRCNIKE